MAPLLHRAAIITHGLYDTAVVANLMTSQVSHTRDNMYKVQNAFKYDIRKYFY